MPDPNKFACSCLRCRLQTLIGPIMLITIGVIFLLGQFTPYGFERLWPVILLVAGAIKLAQSSASDSHHTGA